MTPPDKAESLLLAKVRRDARRALVAWLTLDAPPLISDDGHAWVRPDGRPVALDVALVLRTVKELDE